MNVGASELYGRFGMSEIDLAQKYINVIEIIIMISTQVKNFRKNSVYLQISNCVYNNYFGE